MSSENIDPITLWVSSAIVFAYNMFCSFYVSYNWYGKHTDKSETGAGDFFLEVNLKCRLHFDTIDYWSLAKVDVFAFIT